MTGAKGDSFGGASVHVGPDGWALCSTYSGASLPSLYVHAGRLGMSVYLSGETITADHVRFAEELAKVVRGAVNREILLGPPKSKAGRRVVGIPSAIIPALREHLAVFVKPEPGALVFPGVQGGPLRRSNFTGRTRRSQARSTGTSRPSSAATMTTAMAGALVPVS